MNYKILIVDDDGLHAKVLETILRNHLNYTPAYASSGRQAIDYIMGGKNRIDLVLLDIMMPGVDGIQVLKTVRTRFPKLPVIMMTSHNDVNLVVEAMKAGATDYLNKKSTPERIRVSIDNALKMSELADEVERLSRTCEGSISFTDIIGESEEINAAKRTAEKATSSTIPVCIEGESGVGKEMFARAIHSSSVRADKPFVAVNCGAIPETLVESVLFGHEKGAFTGATNNTLGKFREANGGTLFLDEVGELKPDLQVRLLRAVQESEVQPIGGAPVKVNVRYISATNANLEERVSAGSFREDLYYRLKVFPIVIPPLRIRKGDVSVLMDNFTPRIALNENKPIRGIDGETRKMLEDYDWPGNVRELYNTIYRAVVVCDGATLHADHFPLVMKRRQMNNKIKDSQFATENPCPQLRLVTGNGDFRPISDVEAEVIKTALDYYDWHISEVARRLGIGRSTLYRKMVDIGIKVPPSKGFELAV